MIDICHAQFFDIVGEMQHAVYVVCDAAVDDGFFIDAVGQPVQGLGKYEVADDRCEHKQDHEGVYAEHHDPRHGDGGGTEKDLPEVIDRPDQALVAVGHRHHIAVVKVAVLKAGEVGISCLLVQGVAQSVIELHIGDRDEQVLIPAVKEDDGKEQSRCKSQKKKDIRKAGACLDEREHFFDKIPGEKQVFKLPEPVIDTGKKNAPGR